MGPNNKCKYQRNCMFSFNRKRAAYNKRKDETITLDTQANLAKSGKGSFYIQREWSEEYEYGKGMFDSEYGDDKSYTSNTISTAYSCHIVFWGFFPPISYNLLLFLSGCEKRLLQNIYDTIVKLQYLFTNK